MRRIVVIVFAMMVGMLCAYSQDNVWSGNLEVQGVKIPLVFHLDKDNPTVDSPAQGARGIPAVILKNTADSIAVNIPLIGASFTGQYQDDKIVGNFTQRGIEIPLVLMPGQKKSHRPQTPKPPYPYTQKEVSFVNGDATLSGTLTLPEGYNRQTPVLIMITGSGLQNRDEEFFEHKPFAVIADALARNGIASLRYDDRGFGKSTGDVVNCTTEDLMKDASSGINMLREQFDRVGALGHSEGGTISLMLGSDNKVDFIVSLAGMIVSGKETLLSQNQHLLSQSGYQQQTVDEYCRLLSLAFDGDDTIIQKLEASTLPTELKQNLQAAFGQLTTPYMQYFLSLDMRDDLPNIKPPVLAINGTKDTQVFYNINLDALNNGLPRNEKNKVVAFDGLNHLLQHCENGSTVEYATIEETISPEVLELICQWIKSLFL